MTTEQRELNEVAILNAVSAFDTALRSLKTKTAEPTIDYTDLAAQFDSDVLGECIDYSTLADWVDSSSVAYELDEGAIADNVCLSDLAGYLDQAELVKQLRESLPQVEDLDVLQSRQNEMWEFYLAYGAILSTIAVALINHFSPTSAAPVNADGELK